MAENVGERPSSRSILGEDGRLSSASAAQSLKYARAQDLPSYPSTGGVQLSSAGAAASLASSQRKSFEHWKPGPIPAANKAALLAKDHKMDPLWQPEASAAGAGAALKAHQNPIEVEPMQPKKPAKVSNPGANYDTPEDTHRKAMMAATAVHNRRRSGSAPMQPVSNPDSTAWALQAANKSHKEGPARVASTVDRPFASGDPGFEAARIQNVAKNNVNRQMYSASPPVSIEVQEKNRQDTLRASAVAMAQKMYAIQQKHIDEAAGKSDGQALAASRARSSTVTGTSSNSVSDEHSAYGYENLEEAARKLAQERLAKIHDEHAEYRNYYGATSPQRRSRLSMRLSGRRTSSVADDDDSDEENSRRIRSQMSIFKSNIAEVDGKKRQQDRDNLLQIAHRNVDSQISKMDEKVFQDTGKASPAQMEKWEKSAREKAQRDSDQRMQNVGKVHIGGGKYLDQSELDAIARARLQPTLDDITEKAEKQRALDEEKRLEEERQREQAAKEKARAAETAAQVKADTERQKAEVRAQKDEEKRVQREQETAERAKRDEERRLRKEQETAERTKRDEEERAQRAAEVDEKERARRDKEMQKKEKDSKPGRFSALFGRSGAAPNVAGPTTGAAAATAIGAGADDDVPAVHAAPGTTVHDQVTQATAESRTPGVQSSKEPETTGIADTLIDPSAAVRSNEEPTAVETQTPVNQDRTMIDREVEPASPNKSGVRSWMKTRFGRKSNAQEERDASQTQNEVDAGASKGKEVESDEMPRSDSMRDVAMAGRTTTNETEDMYGSNRAEISPERGAQEISHEARQRTPSISSISSDEPEKVAEPELRSFSLGTTEPSDSEQRGRAGFRNKLIKKIKPSKEKPDEKTAVPVASNTTDDEFEEARDTFPEETLERPPPLATLTGEGKKPLSPKGSREGSRFTEEL